MSNSLPYIQQQLNFLFHPAPIGMCVLKGENFVVDTVNDRILTIWGKTHAEVDNKSLFDVLPKGRGHGYEELLQSVFITGERFVIDEMPLKITRNNFEEKIYIKFVYEPLRLENGTVIGVMILADEITKLVHERFEAIKTAEVLETKAEELERKIAERTQELLKANVALQEKNQEIALSKHNQSFIIDFSEKFSTAEIRHDFFNVLVKYISQITQLDYVLIGKVIPPTEENFTIQSVAFSAFGKIEKNIAYPMYKGPCEQVIHGNNFDYPENSKLVFPESDTLVTLNVEGYLSYPLCNVNGNAIGLICVMHQSKIENVTTISSILKIVAKRAEIEMERIKYEEVLEESNKTLQHLNQNLERSNKELERFAYVASHDLQEPLRKIGIFSNLLFDSKDNLEDSKKYYNKIQASALRMSDLIKAVLNYSKMAAVNSGYAEIDLNIVLKEVIVDLELLIEENKVKITSHVLPVVKGDNIMLFQLFFNLISNAIKFCTTNPIITISAKNLTHPELRMYPTLNRAFKYVELIFKDNGIGFEQQYAEQIFTIFERLNNKDKYSGTGIGLAMCKKIVEIHGGLINAISELGKGASFKIILPLIYKK